MENDLLRYAQRATRVPVILCWCLIGACSVRPLLVLCLFISLDNVPIFRCAAPGGAPGPARGLPRVRLLGIPFSVFAPSSTISSSPERAQRAGDQFSAPRERQRERALRPQCRTASSHEFEFEYGEFGVFKFMIIRRHSIQTHDNFAAKNS